ncbi:S24 family peptidase [Marinobacter salarius]|jgi:phage repressor protein C with HTH and peptisase S24 domain|uniref:HTH-type transcriptional regulator PrtR n=1 Tax=Marinobacter salarius TaxID=1420917 RepID=A0A1W6K966_9GAMM|nr:helix-turn-helix transcriptional regulator [Marinobacter salarius]ARM83947.1 HTH-type transcriptional regulator PrtR [Marinobacter salarius]MCZ4284582.1 helix-turn-helix transcriptional regulator [Marinobacter salarius]
MALGKRLKQAREAAGWSQEKLARVVGMTQAAIGALEKRDSRQSSKAADLAKALDISLEWLVSGEGPQQRTSANAKVAYMPNVSQSKNQVQGVQENELEFFGRMDAWDSDTPLGPDEVELPLFREVEMAAGGGRTEVIENHGAKLRFAKSTLSRAGVEPANAACATVKGNSMERLIPDGTTVGVDTGDKEIRDGEIYAFDHDGMLRVKYLQRRPGGGLRVISENISEYPAEDYDAEDVAENIRLIGRVFWWSVLR